NASIFLLRRAGPVLPPGGLRPGHRFWILLVQDYTDRFLGVGEDQRKYPHPDVPVRLFERGDECVDRWEVETLDGELMIWTRHPFGQFNLVAMQGFVFASDQNSPEFWSVNSAGGDKQVIKILDSDEVFTSAPGPRPGPAFVRLRPAEDQVEQLWTFIPIDRELYHRNRFCQQGSW
ncbi:hypothetical protein BG003_006267, partial [Podila horticola]